jgi:hypothetical protein
MKLIKLFITTLSLVLAGLAQAQLTIDFTDTSGFGTGPEMVQINDIRVDFEIPNPFGGPPRIATAYYDVAFQFNKETLHLEPVEIDPPPQKCANLSVLVNHAVTGENLPDVNVTVDEVSGSTDEAGIVSFSELPEGVNEVVVSHTGFISASRNVKLVCDDNPQLSVALSPILSSKEMRVILTWGEQPNDLDAHLTGPAPGQPEGEINEADRFHVYWDHKNSGDGVAVLDVDDRYSYGPETVTITPPTETDQFRPGVYRYSVYHYAGSGTLADNAVVVLNIGDQPSRTFIPPKDNQGSLLGPGDVWTVFELEVTENLEISIKEIGTYSQGNDPKTVRNVDPSDKYYR